MKKILFLLTIALAGSLWSAGDVTVQVISAVYEKSVTKELDAKVNKTGLAAHKKIENGRYVVTLGTFKSEHDAQKALKNVRHLVSSDAFVRPVERTIHTAKSSTTAGHTPTVATAHTSSVSPQTQSTLVVQPQPHTPSTVVMAHEKNATSVIVPASNSSTSAIVTKPTTAIISVIPVQSECDKREMHKNEFSEAINYYKNSPFYRFEPVVLRQ